MYCSVSLGLKSTYSYTVLGAIPAFFSFFYFINNSLTGINTYITGNNSDTKIHTFKVRNSVVFVAWLQSGISFLFSNLLHLQK